ncbi:hypothetical protein Aasi_0877 [Candidatus Amoebophilus asiaticus 5a2]|uniref:Uncharacterized protein n=1 Tax=Amoebophilus asiaticus (strain 5a2) TaxID=452471 RepID=B3ESP4_AMOA5|nr:hypothetical protein [Candidatus Amoebophilus asiaticus]ACE06246.1 hypothetical protein Aasi_0877 [Candidatus Amoebophilus asiaticus 5a2]
MNDIVDFILPTCAGVPDAMWIVVSAMLQVMLKMCWKAFGTLMMIKLLWEGFMDISSGTLDLRTHIKTLSHALLVALFLTHYKFIIMYFDSFISAFCIDQKDLATQIGSYLKGSAEQYEQEFQAYSEGKSWFTVIKSFLKVIFDFVPKMLAMVSHGGAVRLMHAIKVMILIPTIILGPISAVLSFLPGPFKKSFSNWSKSYINITSWAITLHIFSVLAKFYGISSFWMKTGSNASLAGEAVGHIILSIGLFIAILLTPTFTSKLLGSAIVANVGQALNMASSKMGLARRLSKHMTKIK